MRYINSKVSLAAVAAAMGLMGTMAVTACSAPAQRAQSSAAAVSDAAAATRLSELPAAQEPSALSLIMGLVTKGRGPKTGYSRDRFGSAWTDDAGDVLWSANSCSTRDDVLNRDLDDVRKRDACEVVAGTFTDPYTSTVQVFSKSEASKWPVDHVVPLSYAWQMGAQQWPAQKRVELANDPLNLVVTTQAVNSAKSDSGPASWLPPNRRIRCAYAMRFAQVVVKYQLAVTDADHAAMENQCQT